MKSVIAGYIGATGLWFAMFCPWTRGSLSFWATMTASVGVLAGYGLFQNRRNPRGTFRFRPVWIVVGLVSAIVLYLAFLFGYVAATALFGFARHQVNQVYTIGAGISPITAGILLLLWIGPCEEIFWRGFLQQRLAARFGQWRGLVIAAVLYTSVHIWAFNSMLLAAALICGLFWGWLMVRYRTLWPGIISHAVWDLVIFVLLPIH